MWTIDQVEINGGFLPKFKLTLPRGLICIIGPRGSGKSTLAEALRFAIKGAVGASKKRLDLLQANVGSGGLVTLAVNTEAGVNHTIKRAHKQPAILLTADGRVVSNVDLDRGTYLRLDAYNSEEIETIADEVLGEKRRALLDDLRSEELSNIRLTLGEHRRTLEANADHIRAARRAVIDLSERIEEFGDVRAKLNALPPLPESGPSTDYSKASKQQQRNTRERKRADDLLETLRAVPTNDLHHPQREYAAELDAPIQMCDALSRNTPRLAGVQVLLGNCLAHGRRQVVDVAANFPEQCRYVLESLGAVYRFDAEAKERGLAPEERLTFHQSNSAPVMDDLHQWLKNQLAEHKTEPNSGLGKAISYLLRHWPELTLFLRQAGAPLDNNIAERMLKKAILHRKNALFYKTINGARVGDLFMSLIHTCELNQVNPFDYLVELLRHPAEVTVHPAEWMPWNYRRDATAVAA